MTAGVQVLGVGRRFGRVRAIEDVSFDIAAGEVLGLLGPNGAGKTTTMRVITGYLRPSAGRVLVDGVDVVADPVAARLRVGYVPESSAVPGEMTVTAFLRYCARLRGVPRSERKAAVGRAIGQAALARVAAARIGTLSRGFRQRVALAQALVHDPPVLVLDEPTSGLDPRQVTETRDLIARLGRRRAVLLSSHLLSEVSQLCRRVVVLDRGRVLAVSDVATLTAATGVVRLELRLTGDLERAAALLAGVEGVTETAVRGGLVVVRGEGDELGPRVSAAVIAAGLGLLELRATTGTLEEAYLRLVRE